MFIWRFFTGFWSVIQAARWLLQQKKLMEQNVDAYLSTERALDWRLFAEKYARALESGNGNLKWLPGPIKWFFKNTTSENRVGWFAQQFLKSEKLARRDPILEFPPRHQEYGQ